MALYNLGAVGLGHWFRRLYYSMNNGDLNLKNGLGIVPFESYDPPLESYGLKKENYYQIKPTNSIPEDFFEELDVVQIASPNRHHPDQTIQALEHDKLTVTEKTYGPVRGSFERTVDYIRDHGYSDRTYVELHYLNKQPTLALPGIVNRLTKNHGKIVSAVATMFEETNEEDIRRSWIFNMENGGIFMDLIHPTEVLYKGTGARFGECINTELYMINSKLNRDDPTGTAVWYDISGRNYAEDAVAAIRVAKGFPHGLNYKALRLNFENGVFLDVKYENALVEFTSNKRGSWRVKEKRRNGNVEVLERGDPRGKTPFALMVDDIVRMLKGGEPPLTMEETVDVFESQWKYQELARNKKMRGGWDDIREYIGHGLEKSIGDPHKFGD